MYFKRWAAGVVFILFLAATCGTGLFAQTFQGSISGQVTDSTGAAVVGATITAKEIQTGATTVQESGAQGYYRVGSLNPGNYTITVQKEGFTTSVRQGIILQVAQQATVGFELAPGAIHQSVTVTAQAAQLQTETSNQGATIDQARMLALPTQGHNPIAGVWSTPGVIVTSGAQRLRAFDISGSSNMSINGAPPQTNDILTDGMSSIYNGQSVSYVPTQESTSEVNVQTTQFTATTGWSLGGIVNMVTKSGTNRFHGAVWEYFENTHLYANDFNSNYHHFPKPSSHINTYGANFGGPILKNRLFFNYTYEKLDQVIPDPFVTSVPTAAQKSGDFSQTLYAPGQVQTIYDPFSTTPALTRTAFPGNIIPTSRLDPVAVKVLTYIPNGNATPNPVTGLNNLTNGPDSRKFTDFFPENTIRVDANLNDTTRIFGRYSRNALAEERGFQFSTNSTLNPADVSGNAPFTRENHNGTVQLTKILNATTVLNVGVGLERFKTQSGAGYAVGHGPGTLNFSSTYAAQAANIFPQFTWANYSGAGSRTPNTQTGYNYTVNASLARSMGPYNLTIGTDLRLLRANTKNPGNSAGAFAFDQQFTGANPLAIAPSSGNAIASFLMGTPASGNIQVNGQPAIQQKMVSLYMQNAIRLSKKLTMNLGIRWDYAGPLTDRFNSYATFDPNAPNPFTIPTGQQLYGGLVFAGVNGQRRGITKQVWGNFGPRFGVSYQVDRNTVVHGGYGLLYGQAFDDPGQAPGFSQTTNMVTSVVAGVPFNTLDNPFPNGILKPVGASLGLEQNLGSTLSFADPNGKPPVAQQFSVAVQHQLPRDFLVSAAYVGSRFSRLPVTQQINAISRSNIGLGKAALTKQVANPFAGLLPGTALNGATVQQQQLLAPFPQFLVSGNGGSGGGIQEQFRPIGTSSYNAGEFLVSKRLSNGLDFSVAYTISKQLDQTTFANPQDTQLMKQLTPFDIPQNLQINFLWELPFGTGRQFGANLPWPVRAVISGWDYSALARLQKGFPLVLGSNTVPIPGTNPKISNPSIFGKWFNTCTQGNPGSCSSGQTPVWTSRQAYQLQTWTTDIGSVRTPGYKNVDMSLMKSTQFSHWVDATFRADFINSLNTPEFTYNGPIMDVNSANFGLIAGIQKQTNLPRFIRFSLKLAF